MTFPNFLWLRESRWKQGRESFAQYCLACLFIGAPPTGWNQRHHLSAKGRNLLELLWGEFEGEPEFYWECNLGKLPEDRENGWPDLVAITAKRILVMELKTEAGSHRDGQVDWYMRLAAARYPEHDISLIYLTVDPIRADPREVPAGVSYKNVRWTEVAEMIDSVWSEGVDMEGANARIFAGYLRDISQESARSTHTPRPKSERKTTPGRSPLSGLFSAETMEELMAIYRHDSALVAADGKQRALDMTLDSPEDAKEMQRALAAEALLEPEDSPVHQVLTWVWREESSGGKALSQHGAAKGVEIRISKRVS